MREAVSGLNSSNEKYCAELFYAAKRRFADYYAERFKIIAPYNPFPLIKGII